MSLHDPTGIGYHARHTRDSRDAEPASGIWG